MKDILRPENKSILTNAIAAHPLVALDFDGTLAPLVDAPDAAQMNSSTRRLLVNLSRVFPCAIISGRALGDLKSRLRGIPLSAIVGNHGAQWAEEVDSALHSQILEWEAQLQRDLPSAGIIIENKLYSLSVHTRDPGEDVDIRGAISQLKGSRLVGGKRVFNILPAEAPNKGQALLRMLAESGRGSAIYVGDDETDEDAFACESDAPVLSVRVGHSKYSRAQCFIQNQELIDELLARMLSAK